MKKQLPKYDFEGISKKASLITPIPEKPIVNDREKRFNQLDDLEKTFTDTFKDEDIIYHYTSAEGFRGIVESKEIWLTNAAFTNDTTECQTLQTEINSSGGTNLTNPFVIDAIRLLSSSIDNIYLASFSKDGNSLNQWRAYGNFCIGFKAKKLIKSGFRLCNCVYDSQTIKNWIDEKSEVNEWKGSCLNDQAKRFAATFLASIAAKKWKNKNYKSEEEVRLVATSDYIWKDHHVRPELYENLPPIHFRDHPILKVPVPYVKFFITDKEPEKNKKEEETKNQMKKRKLNEEENSLKNPLPITEVKIGPMSHRNEAKLASEILLHERGYDKNLVTVPSIPYRGF